MQNISHYMDLDLDPYPLFPYRTRIQVRVHMRVRLRQCKWAIMFWAFSLEKRSQSLKITLIWYLLQMLKYTTVILRYAWLERNYSNVNIVRNNFPGDPVSFSQLHNVSKLVFRSCVYLQCCSNWLKRGKPVNRITVSSCQMIKLDRN